MKPFLTLNEVEVKLYADGEILRVSTELFSDLALLNAYLDLGKVVHRRLSDVRAASPGDVAGRVLPTHAGR